MVLLVFSSRPYATHTRTHASISYENGSIQVHFNVSTDGKRVFYSDRILRCSITQFIWQILILSQYNRYQVLQRPLHAWQNQVNAALIPSPLLWSRWSSLHCVLQLEPRFLQPIFGILAQLKLCRISYQRSLFAKHSRTRRQTSLSEAGFGGMRWFFSYDDRWQVYGCLLVMDIGDDDFLAKCQ